MGQAPRTLGWEGDPGCSVTSGASGGVQHLQAPVVPVPHCGFPQPQLRVLSVFRLKLSSTLLGSWEQEPFCVSHFLMTGKK